MISLSIIIVSYRCWDRLDACLKSIAVQTLTDIEVIVVDNHSNDGRVQQFISMHPQVRFILQDTNPGFAQACNKGASVATNQWLLFLNPDTILPPDTLKLLLAKANDQPTWKLIGIRQFNDHGKDTHPHGLFLKWWNIWPPMRSLERLVKGREFSKYYLSSASVSYPDWISGSFVLIRQDDFQELGGWDERFWMYCEDMDLSKRAAMKGWSRVMYNEISCIHSHGGSSRINHETAAITKSAVIRSTFIYLNKHLHGLGRLIAKATLFKITLLELLISFPFSKKKRLMAVRFLSGK
ncbi:MAG: glycosyltransferase family 2 protein [bacterium]|jgi:N-acetylglucosaminyl-diphospho-decaprenol L-rhamnosyltransferase